jgi:hypothetical protein
MRFLRACLDPRVLVGLAVAGVAIAVLAPGLVGAAFPLLLVAACPLSMAVMMLAMRQPGQGSSVAETGPDRESDLRRELLDVQARQRGIETHSVETRSGVVQYYGHCRNRDQTPREYWQPDRCLIASRVLGIAPTGA